MSEAFEPPLCFVVGIGPGTGLAVARKFAAEGYRLAFSSRDRAKLDGYEKEIPGSRGYVYDVRDVAAAERVVAELRAGQGAPHVVVYNTGPGAFVDIDRAEVEDLQSAWEINTRGLFAITKALLPDLRAQRGANLIVMGATASWRGGAKALPFASAIRARMSVTSDIVCAASRGVASTWVRTASTSAPISALPATVRARVSARCSQVQASSFW
mgnify:CR=1 FL=1